jgi:hypothetical protein
MALIIMVCRYLPMALDENFKNHMKKKYFELKDSEKQWL